MFQRVLIRSKPALRNVSRVSSSSLRRPVATLPRYMCTAKVGGEGSHSDFAPKKKAVVEDTEDVQKFLGDAIKTHDILLFMKGSPQAPRCGFSAKVTQILQQYNVDYSSADVLSSNEIREGIKQYSQWPTIPQLFVGGEFIGGCDIITEMHNDGELATLLEPYKTKEK